MNTYRIAGFKALSALTLSFALAGQASAALTNPVYIDFGYTGSGGMAPQAGTPPTGYESFVYSWNSVDAQGGYTIANMVDSGGSPTGLGLTVHDQFGFSNNSGIYIPDGPGTTPNDGREFWQAANDSLYVQNGGENTGGVTISGLDPLKTYDLSFIGVNINVSGRYADITLTGASANPLGLLQSSTSTNTYVLGATGIAPSAGGNIVIDIAWDASSSGSFAYVSAVKLAETPEPASLGLLAASGLMVLMRRRH